MTPVPDLSKSSVIQGLSGFVLPFKALRTLVATPRLVLFTFLVGVVSVATLVLLAVFLFWAAPALVDLVWKSPGAPESLLAGASFWAKVLHGLAVAANKLAGVAHFLVTVLVFALLFVGGANALPLAVAAPLMDPLSIETEKVMGFEVASSGGFARTLKEILRAALNTLLKLVVLLLGQAVLLPLLLIPAVGGPLWTVVSWVWMATWVAATYLDVPMARHLYTFDHEVHLIRKRFWFCLGFGGAIALMLWIPLLNLFFVPVAVVAATMAFRGGVAAGVIPPPVAPATGSGTPAP